jgi:hypothetical protein
MEIFLVSFLVFAAVAVGLLLSQRVRGRQLPVGCTPDNCCRTTTSAGFGNSIGSAERGCGRVKPWHPGPLD